MSFGIALLFVVYPQWNSQNVIKKLVIDMLLTSHIQFSIFILGVEAPKLALPILVDAFESCSFHLLLGDIAS